MGSDFPNLLVKKYLFNFIQEPQIINKSTKEVVLHQSEIQPNDDEYLLEGLQISSEAKEIILSRLNQYIYQQIIYLKEKMPRRIRGKNKKGLIKKTIDEKNEILLTEFPHIELFTLTDIKKRIEKDF